MQKAERETGVMTPPTTRLAFFKLNVPDIEAARNFWQNAFGFQVTATFDEPGFVEHVLALTEQEHGPNLMLVQPKPAREVAVGPGHGPVGLVCEDIDASFSYAVEHGAQVLLEPFEAGGVKVAMLKAPQGHEIELVQLPS